MVIQARKYCVDITAVGDAKDEGRGREGVDVGVADDI